MQFSALEFTGRKALLVISLLSGFLAIGFVYIRLTGRATTHDSPLIERKGFDSPAAAVSTGHPTSTGETAHQASQPAPSSMESSIAGAWRTEVVSAEDALAPGLQSRLEGVALDDRAAVVAAFRREHESEYARIDALAARIRDPQQNPSVAHPLRAAAALDARQKAVRDLIRAGKSLAEAEEAARQVAIH